VSAAPEPGAPSDPGEVPRWLGEAVRQSVDELRAFFLTAYEATVRPARLASTWSIGERRALNPVAFLATSLAITGTAQHFLALARGKSDGASTLTDELIENAFPYAVFLTAGLLCHYIVARHGRKPPLRGTLGIALYAGGGPAALLRVFDNILFPTDGDRFRRLHTGVDLLGYAVFILAFADAIVGLHRVRRWRAIWAIVGSFILMGLVAGFLVFASHNESLGHRLF
jgi:hypothetical protein